MSREQKNIKKLVGRIGNEYYFCDYIFNNDDTFHGVVGTELRPVSKEEYEETMNIENAKDYFKDLWTEVMKDGRTESSLEDYCQNIIDCDGDEAFWDFSGYEYWNELREAVPELTREDYPVITCTGGGRSFGADMKWDKIYNKGLWEVIKQIEKGN